MALYRNIQMSFWTDSKVVDNFTPEDRYFYLYLLTNPHTNLAGCYEISFKQIADEIGYTKETIEKLLDRMESVHHILEYSKDTKEILLSNYYRYNWTISPRFLKALKREIANVKEARFRAYLENLSENLDTVYIPYIYPMDTTVTVTDTDNTNLDINNNNSNSSNKDNYINQRKEIIDYLNTVTDSAYRPNTKETKTHINARLNEGFTVEDFKKVIDNKYADWKGTEWEKFLRPSTLFGNKFDGYLNQKIVKPNKTESFGAENLIV
jgi:uncharacterized phage protein (TIGR02220 family)